MAQIITGLFPRQLTSLTSINKQGWLVLQPNEIDDQAYGVQLQTIIDEIGDLPAVAVEYNDVPALLADQSNQEGGILYRVADPLADPAFADLPINEIRAVYYHFRGTATGSVNDYTVLAIPKLQYDSDPKLGANLDAGAFFINARAPEWTGIEASIRALNNALSLNSPEDISMTSLGILKLNPNNQPGAPSRVMIGGDGFLMFEPLDSSKILSDTDNVDKALSTTYVDTLLSITPASAINRGVIEIGLSLKSVVSGSITAFADQGNGRVRVTTAVHGRSAGQYVTISGTTNYNGTYQIKQVPNSDAFDITVAFVATETGTWERALSSEVEVDLRVNGVSVETFTRNIRGVARINISRQITTSLNSGEAVQVFARSNGTDISLAASTTNSILRIVDTTTTLSDGIGTTASGESVDLGGGDPVTGIKVVSVSPGAASNKLRFEIPDSENIRKLIQIQQDIAAFFGIDNTAPASREFAGMSIETQGGNLPAGLHSGFWAKNVDTLFGSGIYSNPDGTLTVWPGAGSNNMLAFKYLSDYAGIDWATDLAGSGLYIPHQKRVVELINSARRHLNVWDVSSEGDDTTGDGSPEAPFLTIQHAIDQASAGDVIRIGVGEFPDDFTVNKELTFIGISLIGENNSSLQSYISGFIDIPDTSGEVIFSNLTIGGDITSTTSANEKNWIINSCTILGSISLTGNTTLTTNDLHLSFCLILDAASITMNAHSSIIAYFSEIVSLELAASTSSAVLKNCNITEIAIGTGSVTTQNSRIEILNDFTGSFEGRFTDVEDQSSYTGGGTLILTNPWAEKLDVVDVTLNAGAFTLNQDSKLQRVFHTSTTITANATASLQNGVPGSVFSWDIQVTGTIVLDFTSSAQTVYCDADGWNSANKDLTIVGGTNSRFELAGLYINGAWNLKVSQEFT